MPAHRRGRALAPESRSEDDDFQIAGGGMWGYHPLEFPPGHGDPKSRTSNCGGMRGKKIYKFLYYRIYSMMCLRIVKCIVYDVYRRISITYANCKLYFNGGGVCGAVTH